MKTGPELIEEMRKGTFSIRDFDDSCCTGTLTPLHVAALLGTAHVMQLDARGEKLPDAVSPEYLLRKSRGYPGDAYRSLTSGTPTEADQRVFAALTTKARGLDWAPELITTLIADYVSGTLSDTHMAALLGAIMVKGLQPWETTTLTKAMADSGDRLSFPRLDAKGLVAVDKHSTGGVGDGTSLVLAPLVAAACDSVYVPMMSGRVLLHTGGTLNKLEAIPGFRVDLSASELETILAETRCAIFGQTDWIAPADKKIYALRDATACVVNDGLIIGSILSKKLAAGVEVLAMDAKYGNGAFLSDYETCRKFTKLIVDVAALNGMKARAFITDMNEPLGMYAGNKLEVAWAVECLNGYHGDSRFMNVTYRLAQEMIAQADPLSTAPAQLRYLLRHDNGTSDLGNPYARFKAMVTAQGGDVNTLHGLCPNNTVPLRDWGIPLLTWAKGRDEDNIRRRLNPKGDIHFHYVTAQDVGSAAGCGYVTSFDVKQIGDEIHRLGDTANPDVGVIFTKQRGDLVAAGDVLAVVLHDGKTGNPEAFGRYIHLGLEPPRDEPIIREMIVPQG